MNVEWNEELEDYESRQSLQISFRHLFLVKFLPSYPLVTHRCCSTMLQLPPIDDQRSVRVQGQAEVR